MNIARGLLRLWFVGSVFWFGFLCYGLYNEWDSIPSAIYVIRSAGQEPELLHAPYDIDPSANKISMPDGRILVVSKEIDLKTLQLELPKYNAQFVREDTSGVSEGHRQLMKNLTPFAIAPFAILAVGAALYWAFSGFKRKPT